MVSFVTTQVEPLHHSLIELDCLTYCNKPATASGLRLTALLVIQSRLTTLFFKMTQRKSKLFPRQVSDIGAFIFVCIMMPATYLYEASLVIPSIYRDAYSSLIMHNLVGFFLLFNLIGNFIGLWLTDTSTRFIVLPSVIKNSRWKFCASCESVRPPR